MARGSTPGPIEEEWLRRAAAHYLARYATSRAHLAEVLERKIRRRAALRGEEPEAFFPLVGETVARFAELGLLDDLSYAEMRIASLRRKGGSRARVEAQLARKGVPREIAEMAMAEDEGNEEEAAKVYARRRRLGPYRIRERGERRDRDVAAMMRAGFPASLAIRVVDGSGEEEA